MLSVVGEGRRRKWTRVEEALEACTSKREVFALCLDTSKPRLLLERHENLGTKKRHKVAK